MASDGNPDILNDLTDAEQDKMVDNFNKKASVYAPRLQKVFESATSSISTSPVIWALYAELCIALGNLEMARECCSSELRMLKSEEGWADDESLVKKIVQTSKQLTKLTTLLPESQLIESCKATLLTVQNAIDRISNKCLDSEMKKTLNQSIYLLKSKINERK